MIDWRIARTTGHKLVRPGPEATNTEIDDIVAQLRQFAREAQAPVQEFTALKAPETQPALIVDRPGWISANVDSFSIAMEPFTRKMAESMGPTSLKVAPKVAGVQLGAMLAFLGARVLGQYDPFYSSGLHPGRLLLVAPNVMQVERTLKVDSRDFRLWVCLHEETHRVQFSAVPWMREFLMERVEELAELGGLEASELFDNILEALPRIVEFLRGSGDLTLSEIFETPAQRALVDDLTGLMSLLEGHADVVMDGIGAEMIPSTAKIRRKFNARRTSPNRVEALIRQLLGLDKKMAQYSDGARFVRFIVDAVGMEQFNAVFAESANLPSKREIHHPREWMDRVLA